MSMEKTLKNPRLLEALEYLDKRFIAEVFDDLKVPSREDEYVPGKRTPFKYWRQFVALAACLILLSMASPIANYVVEAINSFAAGWGSETTELDTTEELTSDFDPDFDPNYDLTAAELDAFIALYENRFTLGHIDILLSDKRNFYGKCGDNIIFWTRAHTFSVREIYIGEYLFSTPSGERIWVANETNIYSLTEAYEKGLLSYADIIQINKKHLMLGFGGGYIGDDTKSK